MITDICKKLGFPEEGFSVLEEAYGLIRNDAKANALFDRAGESLLHPNEIVFGEATEEIVKRTGVDVCILNAVLCVCAVEPLREIYERAGQGDKLDAYLPRLASAFVSCKKDTGVFGIKDAFWQWMFHELQCVRLGRLEYEPFHHFCDKPYGKIKKGDPVILIHIPRGGSLDMDEVMESLKLGYERFKCEFENETVPFMTHSWLLYPPFLNGVFKEGGNIQKFAGLFDIISENTAGYANFPNVFGCPYPGDDLSGVPTKTSLQRSMLDFVKKGNLMGEGYGIFFYNKSGIVKASR